MTRGRLELGSWEQKSTRIPPGHPEGYLEAFAQIYNDAADVILNRREGFVLDENRAPIPNLEDGLAGMNFIDAVVRSSQKNGNWEIVH